MAGLISQYGEGKELEDMPQHFKNYFLEMQKDRPARHMLQKHGVGITDPTVLRNYYDQSMAQIDRMNFMATTEGPLPEVKPQEYNQEIYNTVLKRLAERGHTPRDADEFRNIYYGLTDIPDKMGIDQAKPLFGGGTRQDTVGRRGTPQRVSGLFESRIDMAKLTGATPELAAQAVLTESKVPSRLQEWINMATADKKVTKEEIELAKLGGVETEKYANEIVSNLTDIGMKREDIYGETGARYFTGETKFTDEQNRKIEKEKNQKSRRKFRAKQTIKRKSKYI